MSKYFFFLFIYIYFLIFLDKYVLYNCIVYCWNKKKVQRRKRKSILRLHRYLKEIRKKMLRPKEKK